MIHPSGISQRTPPRALTDYDLDNSVISALIGQMTPIYREQKKAWFEEIVLAYSANTAQKIDPTPQPV
jgi:hypothetical protein